MHPNLSFEQAPPPSVPYRFFLTAPWFGVAAGLLLAWSGPDVIASRWTPGALALTHLMVAGFMLQAMCGALLQFVPVAAGGNVWRPRLLASFVHPLLVLAAAILAAAFVDGYAPLFSLAVPLFVLAVGAYVIVVGRALLLTPAQGVTLLGLRLAVVGLAVTAMLGALLATALASGAQWPLMTITNVHAAWGLGGWALMLLLGVSFHVVPMFQLTPPYPRRLAWGLPSALLLALLLWSWQLADSAGLGQDVALVVGMLIAIAYATTTLLLQHRRRRKFADPTLKFFRGAMISLLLFAASFLGLFYATDMGGEPRIGFWLGVLAIPGFFVSAITGMLYKIVPFLNWLHLQRLGGVGIPAPNMREMIPEAAMTGQMRLHFLSVALLLAAVFLPELARPAGFLFSASCAWLGWNLTTGLRAYLRFGRSIRKPLLAS